MSFWNLFKNKKSQPTTLQQLEQLDKLIVAKYRDLAKHNNLAPTSKTSDEEILMIYKLVLNKFREASKEKGEHIKAVYLNHIAFKFFQVFEMGGESWMREHLNYEINKYIRSGLRPDYKKELNLFPGLSEEEEKTKPKKDKKTINRMLVRNFEQSTFKIIKNKKDSNPMAGTPLEGLFYIEILNKSSDLNRKELEKKSKELNLSKEDIDDIIALGYLNVQEKIFTNEISEEDKRKKRELEIKVIGR